MDRESLIQLMTDKFVEANRFLGSGSGMPEEEVENKIEEGKMAIQYILSEIYDVLLANDLLK